MDFLLLAKAVVMGIVEGLTEFLPISSTGHLILVGALLGFDDEKAKVFDIAIQTGAIFAVILVYWQKIRETVLGLATQETARRLTLNIVIAFCPPPYSGLPSGSPLKPICLRQPWWPPPLLLAVLSLPGRNAGVRPWCAFVVWKRCVQSMH